MYAAKVKASGPAKVEGLDLPSKDADRDRPQQAEPEQSAIGFTAGNPRVEHVTGVVHLFRNVPTEENGVDPLQVLPEGHGERVCVLALPSDLGVPEFCTFLGAYLVSVREMRFVRREGARQQCLVFLTLDSVKTAALFFKDFNSRAFSSLEPDVRCHLVFIKDLEILGGGTSEPVRPPAGQTELPSCPVCLERLDQHISGVVTTVCNHKFHSDCLRQWGDESCPVCRYCAHASATTSNCSTCGTSQDLWICLICGHIGCGRYRAKHSIDHWRDSGHVYALELETQRVWDYVGDGYVHRLIQSKTDGKLVEVPSPAVASASSAHPSCAAEQRPVHSESDADFQDALFASKVDAFAAEYNHLLVSQLDSQRQYYEGLLRKLEVEGQQSLLASQAAVDAADAKLSKVEVAVKEASQTRQMLERKLTESTAKLTEVRKERDFLKTLSDSMICDQTVFRDKLAAAEKECAALKIAKVELEDQVRDLMIFIEARQTVANNGGELQDASLVAAPTPRRRNRRS